MTIGHEMFISPTDWDIGKYSNKVGHSIPKEHVDAVIAGANAYSFAARGQDPINAFLTDELTPNEAAMQRILETVDMNKLSGNTSVHKGVAMHALISKNVDPDKLGDMSPQKLDELAEKINEQLDTQQRMKDEFGEKGGKGEPTYMPEKDIDPRESRQMAEALKMMARVSKLPALDKGKGTKKIWDTGKQTAYRQMESMQDALDVHPIESVIDPFYEIKLLGRNYFVPRKYDTLRLEQDIVLVTDYSGSMRFSNKHVFILATLLHFAKRVKQGKMTLYAGKFVTRVEKIERLDTFEKIMQYIKEYGQPNGGDTEVGKVVEFLQGSIAKGKLFEHTIDMTRSPEVIVINDGVDYVNPNTTLIAPLNAVCLYAPNEVLKTLCSKSKGFYEEISGEFF